MIFAGREVEGDNKEWKKPDKPAPEEEEVWGDDKPRGERGIAWGEWGVQGVNAMNPEGEDGGE